MSATICRKCSPFIIYSFILAVARVVSSFPKYFVFASLCSFICLNFQDLCASLLGDTVLRIHELTFISCFVIDFLSI